MDLACGLEVQHEVRLLAGHQEPDRLLLEVAEVLADARLQRVPLPLHRTLLQARDRAAEEEREQEADGAGAGIAGNAQPLPEAAGGSLRGTGSAAASG